MPKFFASWLRKFADPRLLHENHLQDQRIGELMRENSRLTEEVELVNNQLSYALDLVGQDKTDFTQRSDGNTPENVRGVVVEARMARGQPITSIRQYAELGKIISSEVRA